MRTVNLDEAIQLVRDAVALKGEDYVYEPPKDDLYGGPTCLYAFDGKPSCIVGHVFAALGVPIKPMEYGENSEEKGIYSFGVAGDVADRLEHDELVGFTIAAKDFLRVVQRKQDEFYTWSDALQAGLAAIPAV